MRDSWIFVFDATAQHAVQQAAEQAAASVGQRPGHVYQHSIRGFAARLAAKNRHIKYYEADQVAS